MPGTVVGHEGAQPTQIDVLSYGPDGFDSCQLDDAGKLPEMITRHPVVWINIAGHANVTQIQQVLNFFSVHPLAREDVFNLHQRPKVEDYGQHLFLVAYMVTGNPRIFEQEQVSILVGEGWVLTFQERQGECFALVRARISKNLGQIRSKTSSYLVYALVDALIDHYFPIAEEIERRHSALETEIIEGDPANVVLPIHQVKSRVQELYQLVSSHRDMLNNLIRPAAGNVDEELRLYFRDCLDHTLQLMENLAAQRESLKGLLQLSLAMQSQRTNDVMKFLTIVASIFIPLTFVTGVYGMNFDTGASPFNMPELSWKYGYVAVISVMLLCATGMLAYFYRQGWFHRPKAESRRRSEHQHGLPR